MKTQRSDKWTAGIRRAARITLAGMSFWVMGCKASQNKAAGELPDNQVRLGEGTGAVLVDRETAEVLKRHRLYVEPDVKEEAEESVAIGTMQGEEPAAKEETSAGTDRDTIAAETETPSQAGRGLPAMEDQALAEKEVTIAEPAGPAIANPELADKKVSVNFDQTDIRFVIKTISDITGINFIVDDAITGTVTVLSPTEIRVGDLYGFLESILGVKGYAAVPSGDHVKIVAKANANQYNLQMRVGANPEQIPLGDGVVTQVFPMQYADASEVSEILSRRLPAGAQIATYARTNTILVTDTSSNLHQLAKIIRELDVPGAQEEVSVMPLRYASAVSLSRQIGEILEKNRQIQGNGGKAGSAGVRSVPQIQPDSRTNSLVVIATRQDTRLIEDLVKRLDVDRPKGADEMHVMPLRNAQAKELAESLSASLAEMKSANEMMAKITPDESTNALIINAYPQDYQVIAGIVEKLDVAREKVLVELLIIEVNEDVLKQIGVDWSTLDGAVSGSVRGFGRTNYGIRDAASAGTLGGLSVGMFKKIDGTTQIGTILSAMENLTGVNILSTPHILTSNHKQAKIIVGDNIPYVTQSRITETDPSTPTVIQTIEYKDVGVSMNITPHVSAGGQVRLVIDSEFSQVVETTSGTTSDTPTTAKRKINTEIPMQDGSTIVIGGLIRDSKTTVEKKIPLLGDLPLVGQAFRMNRDQIQKVNLLMFITPYVLSDSKDMEKITQKKQAEISRDLDKRVRKDGDRDELKLDTIWR